MASKSPSPSAIRDKAGSGRTAERSRSRIARLRIELRDLTGFDGRCDALFFTTDLDFISARSSGREDGRVATAAAGTAETPPPAAGRKRRGWRRLADRGGQPVRCRGRRRRPCRLFGGAGSRTAGPGSGPHSESSGPGRQRQPGDRDHSPRREPLAGPRVGRSRPGTGAAGPEEHPPVPRLARLPRPATAEPHRRAWMPSTPRPTRNSGLRARVHRLHRQRIDRCLGRGGVSVSGERPAREFHESLAPRCSRQDAPREYRRVQHPDRRPAHHVPRCAVGGRGRQGLRRPGRAGRRRP